MKVVLLAAGRSIRMQPIQDKNFLKFFGRPLIAQQLEALVKASFKEILVIGGKHNLARLRGLIKSLSNEKGFAGAKIILREQKDLSLGMAGAILSAASWIKNDSFLILSGNDVVAGSAYELIKKNIKKGEGILLARKVNEYFPGGYLKINAKNEIQKIIEKPGHGKEPSKFVNIVLHFHPQPKALMEALKAVSSDRDDRYEVALQQLFNNKIIYRALVFTGFWQPLKFPWHVHSLMNYFLGKPSRSEALLQIGASAGRSLFAARGSLISKTAVLNGEIFLDEGVRVLDNANIQGPAYIGKNSVVATNALVRQSHIGENCVIGFGSEVARSFVGDGVWTHTNYIGDSIIGNDVSFGAGTVTGNLRLDEANICVAVNGGDKVDCGSNKFGLVTGDHIRVGVNTSFMPGVKVGSNSFVGAGIVVGQDIPENSYVTGKWDLKIKENRAKILPRNKVCHPELVSGSTCLPVGRDSGSSPE